MVPVFIFSSSVTSPLLISSTKIPHKPKIKLQRNHIHEPKNGKYSCQACIHSGPGHGHIVSAIEIAKLLVNRDHHLSITVLVIKPPNSGSGSGITAYIETLATNATSHISFIELPQDETRLMHDSNAPLTSYDEFIKSHCKYVRNIVAKMISQLSQQGTGRVIGFVIDMFCTCMIDVANEFNVPTYAFFTSSAAFLGFKLFIQTLYDDKKQDVIELSNSDTKISVPSYIKPMPTKVFPSIFQTEEALEFILRSARRLREVKAIVVNTFFELETHAIEWLSFDNTIPHVYHVGPILNLEGGSGKHDDVIKWLDSQPPSSVVLLCFGSMGSFDEFQLKEIAHALERSGYPFVWSLRGLPSNQASNIPCEYEDPRLVLPEGFLERTVGLGKVIGWAPQVAVLSHEAIGGFVSHCGWNSLLESLWFGVPSASWPMYAEQQLNAFEMVVDLGLAVEIKLDYKMDLFNPRAARAIVSADVTPWPAAETPAVTS